MKTITHLVFAEPPAVCDIEAGTFTFCDKDGEETSAKFFVRTCADINTTQRVDDYNEQYCDMYMQLVNTGCERIRYTEKVHNEIF